MAKARQELSKLGKQQTADHLRRLHPFLQQDFPTLTKKELTEETFKKLFPDDKEYQLWKLEAIWKFQQCDTKTRETSTTEPSPSSAN